MSDVDSPTADEAETQQRKRARKERARRNAADWRERQKLRFSELEQQTQNQAKHIAQLEQQLVLERKQRAHVEMLLSQLMDKVGRDTGRARSPLQQQVTASPVALIPSKTAAYTRAAPPSIGQQQPTAMHVLQPALPPSCSAAAVVSKGVQICPGLLLAADVKLQEVQAQAADGGISFAIPASLPLVHNLAPSGTHTNTVTPGPVLSTQVSGQHASLRPPAPLPTKASHAAPETVPVATMLPVPAAALASAGPLEGTGVEGPSHLLKQALAPGPAGPIDDNLLGRSNNSMLDAELLAALASSLQQVMESGQHQGQGGAAGVVASTPGSVQAVCAPQSSTLLSSQHQVLPAQPTQASHHQLLQPKLGLAPDAAVRQVYHSHGHQVGPRISQPVAHASLPLAQAATRLSSWAATTLDSNSAAAGHALTPTSTHQLPSLGGERQNNTQSYTVSRVHNHAAVGGSSGTLVGPNSAAVGHAPHHDTSSIASTSAMPVSAVPTVQAPPAGDGVGAHNKTAVTELSAALSGLRYEDLARLLLEASGSGYAGRMRST